MEQTKLPTLEQAFNAGVKLGHEEAWIFENGGERKLEYENYESYLEVFEEKFQPIPFRKKNEKDDENLEFKDKILMKLKQ